MTDDEILGCVVGACLLALTAIVTWMPPGEPVGLVLIVACGVVALGAFAAWGWAR